MNIFDSRQWIRLVAFAEESLAAIQAVAANDGKGEADSTRRQPAASDGKT